MSAMHHYSPQNRSNTPTCQRAVLAHVNATTNWAEVTCKWCLRLKPLPRAAPEGEEGGT